MWLCFFFRIIDLTKKKRKSVLYLDGVKFGDTQHTIIGFGISALYLLITRSQPLNKLSAQRPFASVFTPYMFVSLLGQFAIHLYTLIMAVEMARPHQPTDAVK